jgi:hypothetical protein
MLIALDNFFPLLIASPSSSIEGGFLALMYVDRCKHEDNEEMEEY